MPVRCARAGALLAAASVLVGVAPGRAQMARLSDAEPLAPCAFPFEHKGAMHSTCVPYKGALWCKATDPRGSGRTRWGVCESGTQGTQPGALPVQTNSNGPPTLSVLPTCPAGVPVYTEANGDQYVLTSTSKQMGGAWTPPPPEACDASKFSDALLPCAGLGGVRASQRCCDAIDSVLALDAPTEAAGCLCSPEVMDIAQAEGEKFRVDVKKLLTECQTDFGAKVAFAGGDGCPSSGGGGVMAKSPSPPSSPSSSNGALGAYGAPPPDSALAAVSALGGDSLMEPEGAPASSSSLVGSEGTPPTQVTLAPANGFAADNDPISLAPTGAAESPMALTPTYTTGTSAPAAASSSDREKEERPTMMTLTPTYATGSNASSSTAAATPAPPPAAPAQYSVPPQSPGVSLVPSPSSYPSPPAVVDQKADAAKVEGAVANAALQSAAISGAISAVTGGSWRSAAIRGGLSAGAFALIRARRKRLSEERAKSGIVTSEGLGIDPSNPYDVTADELAYVEAYYDDNEAPAMMMNAPIQPQGSRLYCTPAKAVPPTASLPTAQQTQAPPPLPPRPVVLPPQTPQVPPPPTPPPAPYYTSNQDNNDVLQAAAAAAGLPYDIAAMADGAADPTEGCESIYRQAKSGSTLVDVVKCPTPLVAGGHCLLVRVAADNLPQVPYTGDAYVPSSFDVQAASVSVYVDANGAQVANGADMATTNAAGLSVRVSPPESPVGAPLAMTFRLPAPAEGAGDAGGVYVFQGADFQRLVGADGSRASGPMTSRGTWNVDVDASDRSTRVLGWELKLCGFMDDGGATASAASPSSTSYYDTPVPPVSGSATAQQYGAGAAVGGAVAPVATGALGFGAGVGTGVAATVGTAAAAGAAATVLATNAFLATTAGIALFCAVNARRVRDVGVVTGNAGTAIVGEVGRRGCFNLGRGAVVVAPGLGGRRRRRRWLLADPYALHAWGV